MAAAQRGLGEVRKCSCDMSRRELPVTAAAFSRFYMILHFRRNLPFFRADSMQLKVKQTLLVVADSRACLVLMIQTLNQMFRIWRSVYVPPSFSSTSLTNETFQISTQLLKCSSCCFGICQVPRTRLASRRETKQNSTNQRPLPS